MSKRIVYNIGSSPVPISDEGHMAFPGDWTVAEEGEALTRGLAGGQLVDRTDEINSKSDPAAWAAKQQIEQEAKVQVPPVPEKAKGKAEGADTMSTAAASPDAAK